MRLLVQHLAHVAKALKEHAKLCGLAHHGGNIGAAREALATHFLQNHLADSMNYLTGEIFDREDRRTGQIDLIIYPRSAPRLDLFGKIKVVFADWVLAALEVKSCLSTAKDPAPSHLKSALDSCAQVKRMKVRSRTGHKCGNGEQLRLDHIPYMIFAFDGPTPDTLRQKLAEYMVRERLTVDMLPDLITVLNRDFYLVKNNGWLVSRVPGEIVYSQNSQPEGVLLGMYAYLTKLIEANSMIPRATPFADYCRSCATEQ